MKMNKKVAGILLAAMSTMIFTGCGSSESEKKADAPAAGSKIVVISVKTAAVPAELLLSYLELRKKTLMVKKSTILPTVPLLPIILPL